MGRTRPPPTHSPLGVRLHITCTPSLPPNLPLMQGGQTAHSPTCPDSGCWAVCLLRPGVRTRSPQPLHFASPSTQRLGAQGGGDGTPGAPPPPAADRGMLGSDWGSQPASAGAPDPLPPFHGAWRSPLPTSGALGAAGAGGAHGHLLAATHRAPGQALAQRLPELMPQDG